MYTFAFECHDRTFNFALIQMLLSQFQKSYTWNSGIEIDLGSRHPVVGLEVTIPYSYRGYFYNTAVLVGDQTAVHYSNQVEFMQV